MAATSLDSDAPDDRARILDHLGFLLEAGSLFASSLDYQETLARVGELGVRSIADYCIIDIVEDGEIKRLHVAHADPNIRDVALELLRFPLDRTRPHLSRVALETGEPSIVPEVTPELLDSIAQSPEHRRVMEDLRPRSFMSIPLKAHGRLLGVLLFVSTERIYDEQDLRIAEKLGQLAGLELDNARLYQEAQNALRARDRILGIVAHDLRNPLNVISMSAELLLDPAVLEDRKTRQVQLILRSAKRMNRLIQDLLDVARIEADRLVLQLEVQHPEKLLQEAADLNAALTLSKPISLTHSAIGELPGILADRDRILQVLSNLIDNSIKFTPAGGMVDLRVEPYEDGVCFQISDTGPGIAEEDIAQLFRPFWQAQAGSLEGAGLGLMIARGIVEAHGGRIWVESTLGKGSTFYFTIPADPMKRGGDRRIGPRDRRHVERRPEENQDSPL